MTTELANIRTTGANQAALTQNSPAAHFELGCGFCHWLLCSLETLDMNTVSQDELSHLLELAAAVQAALSVQVSSNAPSQQGLAVTFQEVVHPSEI